jgi:hypothetical protein
LAPQASNGAEIEPLAKRMERRGDAVDARQVDVWSDFAEDRYQSYGGS